MTWLAFHQRADVLRAVTDEADRRRDGILPTHVTGVSAAFRDDSDLLGALQMRWYTRLSGALEWSLASHPTDRDTAVREAWLRTAEELPGIRAVLDAHAANPTTTQMAHMLERAKAKEQALLTHAAAAAPAASTEVSEPARSHRARPRGSAAFVERLKAALAA